MSELWKKAVIHLECSTDSESIFDFGEKVRALEIKLDKSEISVEEFERETRIKRGDIKSHGSAVFVSHKGRRYLLTARHVLFDEVSGERIFDWSCKNVEKLPEDMRGRAIEGYIKARYNKVYDRIFRVPSLDEELSGNHAEVLQPLMNLRTAASDVSAVTFSSPEIDLAIVSLDQNHSRFADELIRLGYNPIPLDLIEDGPSSEGADIYSIGYPSATALLGQKQQSYWSSSFFSLPVTSWGKVSMLHPQLHFYWCDISIYPGNSGGPVIEDGKLVGIVSQQAILPIDEVPNISTRIPFGMIIKTCFVKELIEKQEAKDKLSAS
ncbi:TPA: trypsin-like peptidase domain-containing protein [Raoultella ornithinolytica]|nr:trypsin-like peptidase domain-containing protein [Raoultella ornithinolytica]HAT2558172.1 trypsin-like peptidase domain-containing protein [Raoultella ornithinolytica]